jgi:hypothetical protein
MKSRTTLALLLALAGLGCGVLSFYQTTSAASPGGSPPFANAIEQRVETLAELKEISALLKEQNALLRSGQVKVIVTELPKLPEPSAAEPPRQ